MLLIADIATSTWSVVEQDEPGFSANIFIGFRDNGNLPVTFSGLSFGYEVSDADDVITSSVHPQGDIQYVSTDQEYCTLESVANLVPEKDYTVTFWAENDGERFEGSTVLTLPRPSQPYPSWTYNLETYLWEPPVAYPVEGGPYIWDEDAQDWVTIDV